MPESRAQPDLEIFILPGQQVQIVLVVDDGGLLAVEIVGATVVEPCQHILVRVR